MISLATKKNNIQTGQKQSFDKKKLLMSALVGFALPFSLIICASLNMYFANATELKFGVWDFLPLQILATAVIGLLLTAALYFTKGIVHQIIHALCSGVMLASLVQLFITNLTFRGLPGDGNAQAPETWWVILDFVIWLGIVVAALFSILFVKKEQLVRSVLSFVVILSLVMQVFMVVPTAVTSLTGEEDNTPATEKSFLTNANMFEVSTKDNIIVFVLDRFDEMYFAEILNGRQDIVDKLDGFTYYSDNISTYPRTYPGITSMITGVNNDFSSTRTKYFENAFKDNKFLYDLNKNNYKVNLYISEYYSYDDASVFEGLVANTSVSGDYTVENPFELSYNMFLVGAYFWTPDAIKSQTVSSGKLNAMVKSSGDAKQYELDDAGTYAEFAESGLHTQSQKNTYSFLHLRGCHSPFNMDENCQTVPDSNSASDSLPQTAGCFKFITEYIDQMKALGVYKDATIIITGDHGVLWSDKKIYEDTKITTLLVKEKGQEGTPLTENKTPVSQANLIPTIVKSAGLDTSTDYGNAYSEVKEGTTRTHYFQSWNAKPDVNYTYEISGSGHDFNNWKIVEEEEIGALYK